MASREIGGVTHWYYSPVLAYRQGVITSGQSRLARDASGVIEDVNTEVALSIYDVNGEPLTLSSNDDGMCPELYAPREEVVYNLGGLRFRRLTDDAGALLVTAQQQAEASAAMVVVQEAMQVAVQEQAQAVQTLIDGIATGDDIASKAYVADAVNVGIGRLDGAAINLFHDPTIPGYPPVVPPDGMYPRFIGPDPRPAGVYPPGVPLNYFWTEPRPA